eukprot:scaffold167444_cov31-Tisochrysis_lutea.AAC.2
MSCTCSAITRYNLPTALRVWGKDDGVRRCPGEPIQPRHKRSHKSLRASITSGAGAAYFASMTGSTFVA